VINTIGGIFSVALSVAFVDKISTYNARPLTGILLWEPGLSSVIFQTAIA